MLELIMVRHGLSVVNEMGCYQGWGDSPLSELGLLQAKAVAAAVARDWAPVQALYCSPLTRARTTAEAVASLLHLSPTVVDGLKEVGAGEICGLTPAQIQARFPGAFERWMDPRDGDYAFPGGESRNEMTLRVGDALRTIIEREKSGRVVAVAHGGSIQAALSVLAPDPKTFWWHTRIVNCSISIVRLDPNGAAVVAVNLRDHLAELPLPRIAGVSDETIRAAYTAR